MLRRRIGGRMALMPVGSRLAAAGWQAGVTVLQWNHYLQYCEAGFAARNISVVQAVYTRPNNRTLQWSSDASG